MNSDEKWISFMNRYFVFHKIRNVDSEKIYNQFISKNGIHDEPEDIVDVFIKPVVEEEHEKNKEIVKIQKIRKLKTKIILDKFSPVEESPVVEKPEIVLGEIVKIKKHKK
jgi:hypothetical protein